MELQIFSDLHTELSPNILESSINDITPFCYDVALCGDIGKVGTAAYRSVLDHCSLMYRNVFVVLGNHEYYGGYEDTVEKDFEKICGEYRNVHPMMRKEVIVDGIRILGCTLWSRIPIAAGSAVECHLNDYRMIHKGSRGSVTNRWTYHDTNRKHKCDVEWLENALMNHRGMPTIILSHHAPLMDGVSHPKYSGQLTNHGFATDLSDLMGPNVLLWAFGHTHHPCDFIHGRTRVVSNPRGYSEAERVGYSPQKVYKI